MSSLPPAPESRRTAADWPELVNDVHSRLNPTLVRRIERPRTIEQVVSVVDQARRRGQSLAIAGGRHSMGGQQFLSGGLLLDASGLDSVSACDPERGLVEVGAGMQWPELLAALRALQPESLAPWTFAQKQTGADRLSMGGAVSSNIHGRGLAMRPFVSDVEAVTIVDSRGHVQRADRASQPELFALAAGGYGLFGVIVSVTLRLVRRSTLVRRVERRTVEGLVAALDARAAAGATYGDFQFAIDADSESFLREGVLSCYSLPTGDARPTASPLEFSAKDWAELVAWAHVDKRRAFETYATRYLETDGQAYHSDEHQLARYLDDYHSALDARLAGRHPGSEMITELCVPREALEPFLDDARVALRRHGSDVIYGTIRLLERDDETFLPYARQRSACVVLNLHVTHDASGVRRAAAAFRALVDASLRVGGSYYLTYHAWCARRQVLVAHPRLPRFLEAARDHDPSAVLDSDWRRHHAALIRRGAATRRGRERERAIRMTARSREGVRGARAIRAQRGSTGPPL